MSILSQEIEPDIFSINACIFSSPVDKNHSYYRDDCFTRCDVTVTTVTMIVIMAKSTKDKEKNVMKGI